MPYPAHTRCKVTLGGSIGSQPWNSSFILQATNPGIPDQASLFDYSTFVGGDVSSVMNAHWKQLNDASTTFDRVELDVYLSGSRSSVASAQSSGYAVTGTNTGTAAASQCIVQSLYTARVARTGRGRMYLPATGALPGGVSFYGFDPTLTAALGTAIAGLFTTLNGSVAIAPWTTVTTVVESITEGQDYPVTSVLIDTRPDRQEHRERNQPFIRTAHAV